MKVVISDSTTIITLQRINRLDVLSNVFQAVCLPPMVYAEITHKEMLDDRRAFFEVCPIKDNKLYTLLTRSLDPGESEAIILAKEQNLSLIIDEKKGRRIAESFDINIMGLIGILLLNHRKGHLSADEALELLAKAREAGFYLGDRMVAMFEDAVRGGR